MELLLDTHILLWSLAEPEKLSRRVRAAITRSENEVWLSPISVWELLVLAERGRLALDDEPRRWVTQALARTPAQEAALTFEIAVRSREIMRAHPDPADRFLLAATDGRSPTDEQRQALEAALEAHRRRQQPLSA